MTILLESDVPEKGNLIINVQANIDIKISAIEAQKRVTRYVCLHISSQMHGETPTLILRQEAYWRVPVHLTFPGYGNVGQVGTIDVHVESGELGVSEQLLREIESRAENLARRAPLPAAS